MRRSTVIRAVVALTIVGCLAAGARWLWVTPLAPIPSKAAVGKLNLEQAGANLQVRFVPPKRLSSITLLFPKPMQDSGEFCAHPGFPLSVRVRVAETNGTSIINELVTKDQMQWTSWHHGPSLLLMLHGWLGEHLNRDREYDLTVTVDSAVADLGQADVFLHWMDGGYLWGRETQRLQLTRRSTE
jgi:hypothetical protein